MRFKQIVSLILVWQVVCVLSAVVALQIFPLQKTFLGGGSRVFLKNPILYSRGNFDGVHYTHIATLGYGYAEQAFFPLYPRLIKLLDHVVGDPYVSGVIISLASFTLGLWFLTKLLALDFDQKIVYWVICGLLVFPTSFFFGAVYTESLFFLLVISAFYFARKGKWLMAASMGGLASYTRFVGVFLFPALVAEWWIQYKSTSRTSGDRWQLAFLILAPTGLLAFMTFLKAQTGDAFAFVRTLPLFGSYRSSSVIMLYQVFYRYAKMIWTVQKGTLLYSNVLYEAGIGFLFLVLAIYAFFKLRLSYVIFFALAYLAPTLTGSFVSLPRYVLVCFPGFILLGKLLAKYPGIRKMYLGICIVMLVLLTALFSTGYWIA